MNSILTFRSSQHQQRLTPAPTKLAPRHRNREKVLRQDSTPAHPCLSRESNRRSAYRHRTAVAYVSHSNGLSKPTDSPDSSDQKRGSTPATPAAQPSDRDSAKANSREAEIRDSTPLQQERGSTPAHSTPVPSGHAPSMPNRPDNRSTSNQNQSMGRPSHSLPIRPDSQPPRSRPNDRSSDYGPSHVRNDNRQQPPSDYGRLDRPLDHRDRSVTGGKTPERGPGSFDRREYGRADTRDYDDRSLRAPQRDAQRPQIRGPPQWEPRDNREPRDHRERHDHRGPPVPSAMEPRRAPSSSSLSQDYSSHQRDPPSSRYQGPARQDAPPLRQPPSNISATIDGPAINPERAALIEPSVNPERAALINETGPTRHEPHRSDRDGRRDRGSRAQSPRRTDDKRGNEPKGDERGPSQYGRSEASQDYREGRMPPQGLPPNRDRRDDVSVNSMPTGPRGPRNESLRSDNPGSSRGNRDMFQPTQAIRQSSSQAQDPNYGRLNAPSDPTPSGPRSKYTFCL